jgi:hypothetical protein
MTSATRSTGTAAFHVFGGRHAPEFERFADRLHDFFLHMVHGFLGIHKTFADGIAKKRFALGIEGGDFSFIQLQALLLFMVQKAAFFGQPLVLLLGFRIGHEGINLLADALEFGLLHNGFAKLAGSLTDRIISLNKCFHGLNLPALP